MACGLVEDGQPPAEPQVCVLSPEIGGALTGIRRCEEQAGEED